MRGNYKSPSELLLALRETGKSYWDLVGKPLTPNTGYNINNPHAAEESEYNKWYNGSKLSDEDSEKLQLFLEEYDKDIKSNSNSLPSYKGGKDKFTTFVERMGPKVYRQLHKQGIYNPYIYDNMMRQLAWESDYGTSPLAISNHNYGGVKSSNTEYAKYKDDDAFANYYVSLIRRKYPQAVKAKDAKSYAKELKKVGYYEDSLQNYSQKLSNMSSVSKAARLHMHTNPKQYEVEMLLDDLKKQAVQQPVSTRVEPPINKEPINKEPFVNTPIPTKAPLITRPEYLESNSLIKKSFELNMNNMLLGKEFLFKLPGFTGGKDSGIKEYASNEDMHINPDGSITTRNGNTGSVILPDVNVYAQKDYNSAFDYSGANDVMGTIADFTPVVGDVKQGLEAANDLRKGNYKEAAIGAGLLLLPNVLEKPLKYAGKKAFNFLLDKAPDVVSKYLLGRLAKPIYSVGKEGVQYTVKGVDNATRYASPSYDLYRTINETPISKGSLQRTLAEDFGTFAGPKRVTFFDTPYRQTLDESFNLIKESTKAPKQYGMRFSGKHGNVPEVLGEDGRWHGNVTYYKNRRFSDPIDNSIIVGKESEYQPTDYLFHYDMGNYPIHYNTDGTPMLHRVPNSTGDLGPIWWSENSKWGDKSVVEPRLIKAPDYGNYRQSLAGDNIGDSSAILTEDYPLKDAEFLERDNLLGTMRRGIFAQQPTLKQLETPTIEWRDATKTPKITADNAANITPKQWTAAQDAAIARGDMAEAQRLRDLHFKISAPKTEVVDINGNPQLVVHKTPNTFTVFDNSRSIGKLNWFATPNAYGENGVFATGAGKNPRTMKLYVNMRNAHKPTIDEGIEPAYINKGEDGLLGIVDKDMTNYFKSSRDAGKGFMMSGGVDNPNALKSADAVTYDDKGIRIPLGKRDNFKLNDIRYGVLPFGVGLTGYGLLNNHKTSRGSARKGNTKK